MSKTRQVDFGVGKEAFDKFHIQTFGEKRWKKLRRALNEPTDLVAVINPFVPARWIAKELNRIGAEPVDIFNDKFTKGLAVYKLPDATSHVIGHDQQGNAQYDFNNNALQFDSEGNVITRWPGQLPRVGQQPGDLGLDFETTYINPSKKSQQKNAISAAMGVNPSMAVGPQTFGGMYGRVGYYLLDAASLCAPLLLNPQVGEKVLDVCAAPGGKSLVMSYLLFARDDIRPQATTLRDAIARQRQGGITGGEGAAQIARGLAGDAGAAVEGEFDISDDEGEEPSLLPTPSDDDLFSSGGIDECKVARFLELMFDEGESADCRVEEEILRGLTRGQSTTRVTVTTGAGQEQDADIEELINRDLEHERAAQGVHVLKGRATVPHGRRENFLNAEYLEQQEKHLREMLLRTTGKHAPTPDANEEQAVAAATQETEVAPKDEVAAPPKPEVPVPEPAVPPTAEPETVSEADEQDDKASKASSSGDQIQQLRRSKLVLNDVSRARAARLQQVMRDYLPMSLMPSVDVINSDASGAANFAFVTHTATGQRKIAAGKRTRAAEQVPPGEFDCLLVDAPCSSDRHVLHAPDQLAHWTVQVTKTQAKRQILLLEAAVRSLKVGGRMVYSTCSLSPFENDGAVSTVVKRLGPNVVKVVKFKLEIGERTPMGWILLPDQPNCPWGPLYISYLQRVG